MIDRRAFLQRLGVGTISAAAAICTFAVERLLWVRGEKTLRLPPEKVIELTKPWLHASQAKLQAIRLLQMGGAAGWADAVDRMRQMFTIVDPLNVY